MSNDSRQLSKHYSSVTVGVRGHGIVENESPKKNYVFVTVGA